MQWWLGALWHIALAPHAIFLRDLLRLFALRSIRCKLFYSLKKILLSLSASLYGLIRFMIVPEIWGREQDESVLLSENASFNVLLSSLLPDWSLLSSFGSHVVIHDK